MLSERGSCSNPAVVLNNLVNFYSRLYLGSGLLLMNKYKICIHVTEEGKGDEVVCGAHVRDVVTGEEFDIRAKCVVNATGPFTDAIRKMDDPMDTNICQPSSGVHIVLPDYYRYFA